MAIKSLASDPFVGGAPLSAHARPSDGGAGPSVGAYTALDVVGAAFRTENTVGATMAAPMETWDYDPDFSVWDAVKGTEDEHYYPLLYTARNAENLAERLAALKREERDRAMLADAGWGGFGAAMLAGVVDLPSLIPLGVGVKAGGGVARRTWSAAKAGAVAAPPGAAIAEAYLHSQQQLRTAEESVAAVAAAPVFGAALGAGGAVIGAGLSSAWRAGKARLGYTVPARGAFGEHADAAMKIDGAREAVDRARREYETGRPLFAPPRPDDPELAEAVQTALLRSIGDDVDDAFGGGRAEPAISQLEAERVAIAQAAEGAEIDVKGRRDIAEITAKIDHLKAERQKIVDSAIAAGERPEVAEDFADLITQFHYSLMQRYGWSIDDTRALLPRAGVVEFQDDVQAIAQALRGGRSITVNVGGEAVDLRRVFQQRGVDGVRDVLGTLDTGAQRAALAEAFTGRRVRPVETGPKTFMEQLLEKYPSSEPDAPPPETVSAALRRVALQLGRGEAPDDSVAAATVRKQLQKGVAIGDRQVRVVKEAARKWRVETADGAVETHKTRKAAVEAAYSLTRGDATTPAAPAGEPGRFPESFERLDPENARALSEALKRIAPDELRALIKEVQDARAVPDATVADLAARFRELPATAEAREAWLAELEAAQLSAASVRDLAKAALGKRPASKAKAITALRSHLEWRADVAEQARHIRSSTASGQLDDSGALGERLRTLAERETGAALTDAERAALREGLEQLTDAELAAVAKEARAGADQAGAAPAGVSGADRTMLIQALRAADLTEADLATLRQIMLRMPAEMLRDIVGEALGRKVRSSREALGATIGQRKPAALSPAQQSYADGLEQALGGDDFGRIVQELIDDPAMRVADYKAIAKAFTGGAGRSGQDALRRIRERQASLVGYRARIDSIGGRSAGQVEADSAPAEALADIAPTSTKELRIESVARNSATTIRVREIDTETGEERFVAGMELHPVEGRKGAYMFDTSGVADDYLGTGLGRLIYEEVDKSLRARGAELVPSRSLSADSARMWAKLRPELMSWNKDAWDALAFEYGRKLLGVKPDRVERRGDVYRFIFEDLYKYGDVSLKDLGIDAALRGDYDTALNISPKEDAGTGTPLSARSWKVDDIKGRRFSEAPRVLKFRRRESGFHAEIPDDTPYANVGENLEEIEGAIDGAVYAVMETAPRRERLADMQRGVAEILERISDGSLAAARDVETALRALPGGSDMRADFRNMLDLEIRRLGDREEAFREAAYVSVDFAGARAARLDAEGAGASRENAASERMDDILSKLLEGEIGSWAQLYDALMKKPLGPDVAKDVFGRLGVTRLEILGRVGKKVVNIPPFEGDLPRRAGAGRTLFQGVDGVGTDSGAAQAIASGGKLRGAFDYEDGLIRLFQHRDPTTLKHEFGHLFLHTLLRAAESPKANDALKADAAAVRGWIGADSHAGLTRQADEKFAEAFDVYLATGEAPSKQLANLFERFREFVLALFETAKRRARLFAEREPFSPEVKAVVDKLLAPDEMAEVRARLQDELGDDAIGPPREPDSIGAAAVERVGIEDLTAPGLGGRYAAGDHRGGQSVNPAMAIPNRRIIRARSARAREAGLGLVENYYGVKAVDDGTLEPAVETTVKAAVDRRTVAIVEGLKRPWLDYSKRMGQGRANRALLRSGGRGLNEAEFMDEVGKAMRRGDVHDIPEIADAATILREQVFEPLKEEAIKHGLLPPDVEVETAVSYLSRVWNADEIAARRPEFMRRMKAYFEGGMAFARQEAVEAQEQVETAAMKLRAGREKRDAARAEMKETKARRRSAETRERRVQRGEELDVPFQADEIDAAVGVWQFVRTVEAEARKSPPERLSAWIVRTGGVVDARGDLKSTLGGKKYRPGLIRNEGRSLDDVGEAAVEAGYFTERPEISELLDAIGDDVSGHHVYTPDGQALADDLATARQMMHELEGEFDVVEIGKFRSEKSLREFLGSRSAEEAGGGRDGAAAEVKAARERVEQLERDIEQHKEAVKTAREEWREAQKRFTEKNQDDILYWDDAELSNEAHTAAESVYDSLTDPTFDLRQHGRIAGLPASKIRGPLKDRTLNVKDVDFEDFLVSNAGYVAQRYARVMEADIALTRRFGDADMEHAFAEIREDYKALMDAAPDEPTRHALKGEQERVLNAITSVRDLLRGDRSAYELKFGRTSTETKAAREIVRNALAFNYVQALGDVVASSLSDPIRLWQVHGARAYFSQVLPAAWSRIRGDRTLRRIAVEDAGIAETILNSRIAAMTDIDDPYATRWGLSRYMDALSTRASKMSGIVYWNQFGKELAVHFYMSRLRRIWDQVQKKGFEGVSAEDQLYLRQLKISHPHLERIGRQMDAHGERPGMGLFEPNTARWTDAKALEVFRAAMRADADSVVITPGLGDKPLPLHHTALKPFAQFKSFWFAADQRATIRSLQGSKRRFLGGAMAMAGMGMLIAYYKYVSAGREPPENWGTMVAEGVDRSGTLPLLMEFNNMQEHLTGVGLYRVLGEIGRAAGGDAPQTASRYHNRNPAGALLGPTAGKLAALYNVGGSTFGALDPNPGRTGWTRSTVRAAKQLTPFVNQPLIKLWVNHMAVPWAEEAVE